jgi:CheY-specific phosphatase CheX
MSIDNHFLEFSKPFIAATKNIFETMVSCKIEAQKPSIKIIKLALVTLMLRLLWPV